MHGKINYAQLSHLLSWQPAPQSGHQRGPPAYAPRRCAAQRVDSVIVPGQHLPPPLQELDVAAAAAAADIFAVYFQSGILLRLVAAAAAFVI